MNRWIIEELNQIPIRFYNTLERKLIPFEHDRREKVSLYTCGPTVYSYAHIGNFRTFVFEDVLRRTLEMFGYQVHHVMNITDVDDKTIRHSLEKGLSLLDYTDTYKQAFFDDVKALALAPAHAYPAATDYIPQMIEMIEKLIEKKLAYQGKDGSIYFSIKHFPRYGCLSHLNLDQLKVGARVASDEYEKDSVSDFVVWKAYEKERDGEVFWESPFGRGRPGWHLECSAMAQSVFGSTVDIHCGAVDNIFPHHENELAQSEGVSGKPFVRYWLHSEHLIVDGRKMAKRYGNFYTLRDLFDKGYSGNVVRYLLLSTHYRQQLNFTFEGLQMAAASIERLNAFIARLKEASGTSDGTIDGILKTHVHDFACALGDDLNTSLALASLFELVREGNGLLDAGRLSSDDATKVLEVLHLLNGVLGVMRFEAEEVSPEVLDRLERRERARKERDWAMADQMRDEILALGYLIEDTPKGPRAKRQ